MSFRLAVRTLAKSPGFTTVALITLALGIGANTSMVSVVDALLFRSAPFPDPDAVVQLMAATKQRERRNYSEVEIREIRAQTTAFTALSILSSDGFALSEPGQPTERVQGMLASADMFETFGLQPMLGRAFTEEETQPGRNNVVVLSYAFWQERFGGERDVLGRTVRLDAQAVTIIGVMPERFDYRMLWGSTRFWRPVNFTKDQLEQRGSRPFWLIGRLKPGATTQSAANELAPLAATQEKDHPDIYSGLRYRVAELHTVLIDTLGREISWMLLGLSGFVLLIACANLANLQLARATAGARDLAIRSALGASRHRLIFQQLTESVVLAIAGGALGLFFAWSLNRVLERNAMVGGSPGFSIPIDGAVLACTLLVALLAGVIFGIVPALLASRTDMNAALKAQSRGTTAGRGHHVLRQILIVVEVALALILLAGAGIMQRGFAQMLERETGWDTARVLTAGLPIPTSRIKTRAQRVELYHTLETRLAALPGVEHVALATSLPVFNYGNERPILTDSQSPGADAKYPSASHVMVTPDFFATLGIAFVEGRGFAPDIAVDSPRQIVINEALAHRLWPGRSALGQRLGRLDGGEVSRAEVIGVVHDVESAASLMPPSTRFTVYQPLVQDPSSWVNIVLRSREPETLADPMRRAIAEIDPDMPTAQVGTVRQNTERSQHNLRLAGKILAGFALLGLVLAAVGIYGVISSLVAQRTSEFGIRLALGAQPGHVQALVLRHGLQLSGVGLLLGLGGAYLLARFLAHAMPRVAHPDPLVLAGVSTVLLLVALAACFVPARRATKVDPLTALRAE